ncbi:hypothetical protein ASH00_15770 [Arthrobacter sp. Soil782]|uniref:hypothetical protein n=1 Tax=Arthrobacter sp. Soil782 TaxID=1736410 RepID=UPI0006FC7CC9|nr:hypothetical protein [Arthrobacter sp. Soil782]KRF03242.1 hypothetical protein ASH00_15770 [Arthrobacter sp. Soil782]
MIQEAVVFELFKALEKKLPEVRLAINEMPPGELTSDGIEHVLLAADAAIDARKLYGRRHSPRQPTRASCAPWIMICGA